jgi:hypothetical protein
LVKFLAAGCGLNEFSRWANRKFRGSSKTRGLSVDFLALGCVPNGLQGGGKGNGGGRETQRHRGHREEGKRREEKGREEEERRGGENL